MSIDKNKVVIDYLLQCPDIANSPLYFNLINAENNSIQILTTAEDKATSSRYIDGSVSKRYTFNIITFKSITDSELVKVQDYNNENVDELHDVQQLIDWVQEQQKLRNYPDFGEGYHVESIDTATDTPRFDGINTEMTPPLAMYSISIIIEYTDETNVIFK